METDVALALRGFQPQTQRETLLYQMIVQLQREMVLLRRETDQMRSGRGDVGREGGLKGRPVAGTNAAIFPPKGFTTPMHQETGHRSAVHKPRESSTVTTRTETKW